MSAGLPETATPGVKAPAGGPALEVVDGRWRNLAPPPDVTASGWAAANRVPGRKDDARPGPWAPEPHQPAMTDPWSAGSR